MSQLNSLKKDFIKGFSDLTRSRSTGAVFSDWLEIVAVSMRQLPFQAGELPKDADFQTYEDKYLAVAKRYSTEELNRMSEIMGMAIVALKLHPCDFLGQCYMEMEQGNEAAGQFFTPYEVCRLMAKMTVGTADSLKETIQKKGVITVQEPAAGAGGMMIALAQEVEELGFDPRAVLRFDAIDIARNCFNMSYFQMAATDLQCTVHHGNTLSMEIWESRPTPQLMLFEEWAKPRRLEAALRGLLGDTNPLLQDEPAAAPPQEPPAPPLSAAKPKPDIVLKPQQMTLFNLNDFQK
ncbi:N-6 DNA methylase [Nostoc linckia]|uniref:N-6 DNA methylase n=1 Tax=Nostoc linckia TaxID=92942 RepID=UPI000BFFF698|nr:N-6 DNA methylase [Nostoc linckia]